MSINIGLNIDKNLTITRIHVYILETEEGIDENGEAAMESITTVDLNKGKGTTEKDTELAYRKEKQGNTKIGKATKDRRTTISSNSNRVVTKKDSKTTVNTGKSKTGWTIIFQQN